MKTEDQYNLNKNPIQKRVEKLRTLFLKDGIEALFINNDLNRKYLSGFTGSSGYLFISQQISVLFTDFRYTEQASKECYNFEIVDYSKEGLVYHLNQYIEKEHIKILGFEADTVTYQQYEELKKGLKNLVLKPTSHFVEKLRMIKDSGELKAIQKAAYIADQAFEHILKYIKVDVTELEIALELEFFMKTHGASHLSFDSIVASGVHGSLPHAKPTNKKIQKGEMVTLDFGCVVDGYCSDMTRTIVVGKADTKQKKIYNTVLSAQIAALNVLKAGLTGKEVDLVARKVIDEAGYKEFFGHGLGHSLGLFVHEEPRVSPKGDKLLEENMVVTIEPGIYLPGFGGVRIEDLVCIQKDGYKNYTSSPKQLIEL